MPNIFKRRTRNAFQGPSLKIFEVAIRHIGYRSDALDVGGCVYEVVTPSVTGAIEVSSWVRLRARMRMDVYLQISIQWDVFN